MSIYWKFESRESDFLEWFFCAWESNNWYDIRDSERSGCDFAIVPCKISIINWNNPIFLLQSLAFNLVWQRLILWQWAELFYSFDLKHHPHVLHGLPKEFFSTFTNLSELIHPWSATFVYQAWIPFLPEIMETSLGGKKQASLFFQLLFIQMEKDWVTLAQKNWIM